MSINHAILGLLSWKPASGYELKKIFEQSSFMHWSGNNNQIYKALVQLKGEGLVTSEVQHQESSPSKKIYQITLEGLAELKDWVTSAPEAPEFKKQFLVQLAWADQLSAQELSALLDKYENELSMHLLMLQEKNRRGIISPGRTGRETLLWRMITENVETSYKAELEWVQKLRQELAGNISLEEGNKKMSYRVVETSAKKYIELITLDSPLASDQAALDLVALCGEHDTNLLLLHHTAVSEEFFRLKTGVAGQVLQKWVNYHLKVAMLLPEETVSSGNFKTMLLEANKGDHFRAFITKEEAESWLVN